MKMRKFGISGGGSQTKGIRLPNRAEVRAGGTIELIEEPNNSKPPNSQGKIRNGPEEQEGVLSHKDERATSSGISP